MKKNIVNVSDNSNIEINENSTELLMQGVCLSYECEDFRANNCRMRRFLDAVEKGDWDWTQTWETPTKFLLHILKHGSNAQVDMVDKMNELKERWNCLGGEESCNCNFFDEMKKLKSSLETISSSQKS